MKKNILSYFLLFTVCNVFSQGNYTIKFESYYIKSDSTLLSGGEDFIVAIKDTQSFTYYPFPKSKLKIVYPLGSELWPKSTYFNLTSKLIIVPYGFFGEPKTHVLIVHEYPDIKWTITNEKKLILRDTCIKAIGALNGHEVIAYYNPTLPSGFGHHLYLGLPGTILETYTPDNRIQSVAVSIENNSPEIVEPNFAKRVTEAEYRKRRDKNPAKKLTWQ